MSLVGYRPDKAARLAVAALKSSLGGHISAINADLVADGESWQLPSFAADSIYRATQVEMMPKPERQIRVVLSPYLVEPRGVTNAGNYQFQLDVSATMSLEDIGGLSAADDLIDAGTALGVALLWTAREALLEWAAAADVVSSSVSVDLQDFDDEHEGFEANVTQVQTVLSMQCTHFGLIRRPS